MFNMWLLDDIGVFREQICPSCTNWRILIESWLILPAIVIVVAHKEGSYPTCNWVPKNLEYFSQRYFQHVFLNKRDSSLLLLIDNGSTGLMKQVPSSSTTKTCFTFSFSADKISPWSSQFSRDTWIPPEVVSEKFFHWYIRSAYEDFVCWKDSKAGSHHDYSQGHAPISP